MPRRILISGSTGLIGQRLVERYRAAGDQVVRLVRGQSASANTAYSGQGKNELNRRARIGRKEIPELEAISSSVFSVFSANSAAKDSVMNLHDPCIAWDPQSPIEPATVSGFDIVIHLAGESVASGRWRPKKKARIRDSRVLGTRHLATALAAATAPPRVFISASGINYYGETRGCVYESSPRGRGFLADVCEAWEAATGPLEGVARVVKLRIGMVLAAEGGPLQVMKPLFRLGLGGPIAGGKASISWITLADTIRAIDFIIENDSMHGPINLVAPKSATNAQFVRALGRALHRPAILPVPGWLVRLVFGELANETVLTSTNAFPERLKAAGFRFHNTRLPKVLKELLSD